MYVSVEVAEIVNRMFAMAKDAGYAYVTPECMLYVICQNDRFALAFENCGGDVETLSKQLKAYLDEYMEPGKEEGEGEPLLSQGMNDLLTYAWESAGNSGKSMVELPHMVHALYRLEESYAVYYMRLQGVEHADLLQEMSILAEELAEERAGTGSGAVGGGKQKGVEKDGRRGERGEGGRQEGDDGSGRRRDRGEGGKLRNGEDTRAEEWEEQTGAEEDEYGDEEIDSEEGEFQDAETDRETDEPAAKRRDSFWRQYAVCLNEALQDVNPLIGRRDELERTMQILCRREKNNPLHIGEPGVGKTAITYGLARLLERGDVPEPLKGARIFSLDLGSLLAGTQYRGDFEKRFKRVMDSLSRQEKPIIYMDEIHTIVGAGAVNGGNFDISNMLKPYLAAGHIRFIGATTYEEYKKHFERSKSLVRRFQNVEISEPDVQDTLRILEGLREKYEDFHNVVYGEGVLEYAAEMSAKYIRERCLPDKAIDLIDEAGAWCRMHSREAEATTVDKNLIDDILSKTCHIPKQTVERDETEALATLEERMLRQVYGQEEAVSQVVNAVKFSRAGLLEEGKPLASLLFVGPTGVGKTEIAKSLARELGISLIRFDMSEYEEKHAVAKFIGAPAGYVGYEEGGLLTEEIRKNPHAVLLLDEIEKAHPDIYNLLLQIMDYATLTDNQGRKADFRNVIIIMTSNAGASRIGKPGIGFQGEDVKADVILEEVKRIFQPEFRNRLSRIVVFNGMTEKMAEQIADKKLSELQQLLARKNVVLTADAKAGNLVKEKGISREFGAREIERVIQGEIKPLLVDEILFGALRDGGRCMLTAEEGRFKLRVEG